MKKSIFITRFFVFGLAVSMLFFSPFILDYSLLPRYICLAAVVLISLFLLARSELAVEFKLDIFNVVFIAYALLVLLSVVWAINQPEAFFEATKTVTILSVFLLTRCLLKLERDYLITSVMKISIVLSFVLFSVAIYQVTELKNLDKEGMYSISGLNGHKNLFSSFLFINLFFLLAGYFKLPERWKIFSWIGIILSLFLLYFLKTKAVWIASIIAIAVFVAVNHRFVIKKTRRFSFGLSLSVILILINLFFIIVLPMVIKATLNYLAADDHPLISFDQERLMLWDKTFQMIGLSPFGVGSGNWQTVFPQASLSGLWRAEDLNFSFQRPHNDFLWILSETGWLGLNLFLVFVFSILLGLSNAIAAISEQSLRRDLSLCVAIICGYLAISFFDFPKERIEHGILMSLVFAISAELIQDSLPVKNFGIIAINKLALSLIFVFFLGIFLVGILRYKGEFYTRKMYDAKSNGQSALVISEGNKAMSLVYTIDPTSMPISWYMGNAAALIPNQTQKALEYFKDAYQLAPYNRNVINDLASSYATLGNFEMAKKYYRQVIQISPRFDEPKLNLVAIYINEKNFEMADECIRTVFHDSERRSQYQKIIDVFGLK